MSRASINFFSLNILLTVISIRQTKLDSDLNKRDIYTIYFDRWHRDNYANATTTRNAFTHGWMHRCTIIRDQRYTYLTLFHEKLDTGTIYPIL